MAKKSKPVPNNTISQDKHIAASQVLMHAFSSMPTENTAPVYVSMKEWYWEERELRQICEKLFDWVFDDERDKDDNKITHFFSRLGMHYKTIMRLRKRFEFFEEACLLALQVLGDHREKQGLLRNYSERLVIQTMPQYDHAWVIETERMAKLKVLEGAEEEFKFLEVPTYLKCTTCEHKDDKSRAEPEIFKVPSIDV